MGPCAPHLTSIGGSPPAQALDRLFFFLPAVDWPSLYSSLLSRILYVPMYLDFYSWLLGSLFLLALRSRILLESNVGPFPPAFPSAFFLSFFLSCLSELLPSKPRVRLGRNPFPHSTLGSTAHKGIFFFDSPAGPLRYLVSPFILSFSYIGRRCRLKFLFFEIACAWRMSIEATTFLSFVFLLTSQPDSFGVLSCRVSLGPAYLHTDPAKSELGS